MSLDVRYFGALIITLANCTEWRIIEEEEEGRKEEEGKKRDEEDGIGKMEEEGEKEEGAEDGRWKYKRK